MVAHDPEHELVPRFVSPDDVYRVMPLLSTSTVPSLVVAVATTGFAAADDDGDAAVVVGVALTVPGVVVVELAFELLEQAARCVVHPRW